LIKIIYKISLKIPNSVTKNRKSSEKEKDKIQTMILQYNAQKAKDWATWNQLKPGMMLGAPEGKQFPLHECHPSCYYL
jgi:hypothetical protein